MSSNVLHTIGFRVQKYGSKKEQEEKFKNVFEDNVFDASVFEFGVGMSSSVFEEGLFENDLFEL